MSNIVFLGQSVYMKGTGTAPFPPPGFGLILPTLLGLGDRC
jgi:hypothetical protein